MDICGNYPRSADGVRNELRAVGWDDVCDAEVRRFLSAAVKDGLVIEDRGKYLGLALPAGRPGLDDTWEKTA